MAYAPNPYADHEPAVPRNLDNERLFTAWFKAADTGAEPGRLFQTALRTGAAHLIGLSLSATFCRATHYSASLYNLANAPACGASALLNLHASVPQMRTASSPAGMPSSSSSARASRATPLLRCRSAGAAALVHGSAVNCLARGVPGSAARSLLVQPLSLSRMHASAQRRRRCGAWRTARGAASWTSGASARRAFVRGCARADSPVLRACTRPARVEACSSAQLAAA
jgi:hypothetical protein